MNHTLVIPACINDQKKVSFSHSSTYQFRSFCWCKPICLL